MREAETAGSASSASSAPARLDTVEIETGANPTAAVVWLHGLGADGHDFEPLVPYLAWRGAPPIRYVFPHAPVRPVTLNNGMRMRAWYDIPGFGGNRDQDREGIETSVAQVDALLDREVARGLAPHRIVVAGFSQGGAIAIQVIQRRSQRLAGLIALSTYLLLPGEFPQNTAGPHAGLPAFVGHGTQDPLVPFSWGERAAATLRDAGYAVDWRSYPIPHSVSQQEIADIAAWLQRCFD